MSDQDDTVSGTRFTAHTPETAEGKAAELLAGIWARHGDATPMVRTMAGSPSVLSGYLELSRAMKRSALDRGLAEQICLAVQAHLGCHLCLDAHGAAARAAGVPEAEIELAKQGTSSQPAAAALIAFALGVLTGPAEVEAGDLDALRAHGFEDRQILDVVGLVVLNQLTGAFNLVAGL